MSINFEVDVLNVASRQKYLRSLAQPGHPTIVRLWTGRLLVRFGRWLEGRRPEELVKPVPTGPMPRLAGGHR